MSYFYTSRNVTVFPSLRWSSCTDFLLWESLSGTSMPSQCSSLSSGSFYSLSSCARTQCWATPPQQPIRESCSSCSQGVLRLYIIIITLFFVCLFLTLCKNFVFNYWTLQCLWMLCHTVLSSGSDLCGVLSGSWTAQPMQVLPGRLCSCSEWECHAQVRCLLCFTASHIFIPFNARAWFACSGRFYSYYNLVWKHGYV